MIAAAAKEEPHGSIKKAVAELNRVSATRVNFGVGAKWSNGFESICWYSKLLAPHIALLNGTLHVVMDDGSIGESSKNDLMLLPPGMMPGQLETSLVSSSSFAYK